MGLDLAHGGHLTHGHKLNFSGKTYHIAAYQVNKETEQIDFDEMAKLADEYKPKMIVAGGSAYPRKLDFARFRAVADSVGAILLVDMAHFSGLVAGGGAVAVGLQLVAMLYGNKAGLHCPGCSQRP